MKRFSYAAILRQRMIVAGLTLGLITVMIGVGIDIYISNNTTTIPSSTRALTEPLDPQLDVDTVERLESYETVTVAGAKQFVRQSLQEQQAAAQAEEEAVRDVLESIGLDQVASDAAEAVAEGSGEPESTESAEPSSPFLQ